MKEKKTRGLKRHEIKRVLDRHRNSKKAVADAAKVSTATVSKWLIKQTVSANVAFHAEAKALELLASENSDA